MESFVVNTVRDGKTVNTWVTGNPIEAIQHAEQCVQDYAIIDSVERGGSMPSQIVVTRVGSDYNEKVWEWLPEDLEVNIIE